MIPLLTINQLLDKTWEFTWASTGDPYYRVVFRGQLLGTVTTELFIYNLTGPYSAYPPAIEITKPTEQAASEINSPNFTIQWFGDSDASNYTVQEYISGTWTTIFSMKECGAYVYTYTILYLDTESTHLYRVVSYNELGVPTAGDTITVKIVTPTKLTETDFTITYSGGNVHYES